MNPSSAKTDCDEKCFYEQYEECRYTENHNVECYSRFTNNIINSMCIMENKEYSMWFLIML